jgi:hypothetical protein
MVELMVGLVAVLVLLAGLTQWARLARAQTAVMSLARQEAGALAMQDLAPGSTLASDATFVQEPDVGPDGKPYTSDDRLPAGNPVPFRSAIVDRSVPDEAGWPRIAQSPADRFSALRTAATPAPLFGLTHGHEEQTVPVMPDAPAFYHLIYRADSIDVVADVWLTWTKGLY